MTNCYCLNKGRMSVSGGSPCRCYALRERGSCLCWSSVSYFTGWTEPVLVSSPARDTVLVTNRGMGNWPKVIHFSGRGNKHRALLHNKHQKCGAHSDICYTVPSRLFIPLCTCMCHYPERFFLLWSVLHVCHKHFSFFTNRVHVIEIQNNIHIIPSSFFLAVR